MVRRNSADHNCRRYIRPCDIPSHVFSDASEYDRKTAPPLTGGRVVLRTRLPSNSSDASDFEGMMTRSAFQASRLTTSCSATRMRESFAAFRRSNTCSAGNSGVVCQMNPTVVITLDAEALMQLQSVLLDEDPADALDFIKTRVLPQIPKKGTAACDSTRINPYLWKDQRGA